MQKFSQYKKFEGVDPIMTAEKLMLEIASCFKQDYTIQELNEIDPELVPYLIKLINDRTSRYVKEALTAAHKNMQLPEEDLEFTLSSYPLSNIV